MGKMRSWGEGSLPGVPPKSWRSKAMAVKVAARFQADVLQSI